MRGKAGIVTGAASGIGEAIVRRLVNDGAQVAAVDVNREAVAEFAREWVGRSVTIEAADITDPGCASRLVERCLAATGRLDFLVNVAGIMQPDVPLQELPADAFERVLSVNLSGSFLCYRAAAEAMIRLKSGGAILNIVSTAGIRPVPRAGAYVASKHGLVGLTTTAALEVAAHGIRVNAICPGVTDTPLFRASISRGGLVDEMKNQIPMRRIAEPREIANAAAWLLGDEASYVTGAVLPVDGGLALT